MTVDTIALIDDDTALAPALSVRIFGKNNCPICDATTKVFDRKGVPYEYINVETDLEPRADFDDRTPFDYVVATYGRQMPVVVVTDDMGYTDWWSGSAMNKWLETVERFAAAGLLIPEEERAQ